VSVTVRLLPEEVSVATHVGHLRFETCRQGNWRQKPGAVPDDGMDVEAACAEVAVAKHLNLYPNFAYVLNRDVGDVGGYEVRFSPKASSRLLIRPGDDLSQPYVLVTGGESVYTIRGWLRGHEVREGWLTDLGNGRPSVYAVPRSALRPFK
jgi:hypothetical protein